MRAAQRSTRRAISLILSFLLFAAFSALALLEPPVWPFADGNTLKDGKLTVDISHTDQGYAILRCEASKKRMRARVGCGKNGELYYDLNSDGSDVVIPLQFGSGDYKVELFMNSSGKKYSAEGSVSFSASLEDERDAYLVPNQYVSYTQDTEAVALSQEICAGITGDQAITDAVFEYITTQYTYDWNRAKSIQGGTLPDIDYCTGNKMGVCQDLAATMCCMLRVQGVPCKLVIGYIGKYYHAWCGVYIDGKETLVDPTVALGGAPNNMKYSVERWY